MSADLAEQKTKYVYKGRFGAVVQEAPPPEEPSHEEVDAFVRSILGLRDREKIPK